MSNWVFILAGGGVSLTVGDVFMKEWVRSDSRLMYALGMTAYITALAMLAYSFRHYNIAVASIMLTLFNVIALAVVSYLAYGESLSSMQAVGLCLGLAAVVAMEIGTK
jgi:multidrug transporter EmrE-like cation transporter